MSKITLSDIITALPSLTPDNLRTVIQAANTLLDVQGPSQAPTGPADMLFNALSIELSNTGIRNTLSFEQVSKLKGFRSAVLEVDKFYNEKFSGVLKKRNDRIAMTRMLISGLIEVLRKQNVPITLNTVTSNLSRLPEICDDLFPGYVSSGLGRLIVRAMARRKDDKGETPKSNVRSKKVHRSS